MPKVRFTEVASQYKWTSERANWQLSPPEDTIGNTLLLESMWDDAWAVVGERLLYNVGDQVVDGDTEALCANPYSVSDAGTNGYSRLSGDHRGGRPASADPSQSWLYCMCLAR